MQNLLFFKFSTLRKTPNATSILFIIFHFIIVLIQLLAATLNKKRYFYVMLYMMGFHPQAVVAAETVAEFKRYRTSF